MPRALHKVQKQISKKKGRISTLHENSRDAQRLRRGGLREDKLAKLATATSRANQAHVDRVAFFHNAIEDGTGALSPAELGILIEKYIERQDDELNELKAAHRPGRPTSTREDHIRRRIEAEEMEYKTGFWAPDILDPECRSKLEQWSGDWSSLSTLRFLRMTRDGKVHKSSFPPKGQS